MTTMIEKVAKAIYEKRNGKGCTPWAKRGMAHKAPYFADARAAIEAMRDAEPTDAMMSSMWSLSYSNTRDSFTECWKAMIDAALSEEKAE